MTPAVRRVLLPCLTTLLMMAILIGLGTWQLYRLHWKERILRQIAAAESATPGPLGLRPSSYMKISVNGRFLFDHAALYGAEVRDTDRGPTLGAHQIVPLERDGGEPIILVDRGWIPEKWDIPLNGPATAVSVTGYVRPRDTANWFSAPDDPAARRFYTLDPVAIGTALDIQSPAPFTLVALGTPKPGTFPIPAEHLPRPPNNHLSYVITWYGLAIALAVIFAVWIRKALKL